MLIDGLALMVSQGDRNGSRLNENDTSTTTVKRTAHDRSSPTCNCEVVSTVGGASLDVGVVTAEPALQTENDAPHGSRPGSFFSHHSRDPFRIGCWKEALLLVTHLSEQPVIVLLFARIDLNDRDRSNILSPETTIDDEP